MSAEKPEFRELTEDECRELLTRNHVGRVAFSYHDHVDIEPINYIFEENWIYGRTSSGTKLRTLAHNRWLAFETDEISGIFDWSSVVVKGSLFLLEAGSNGAFDHAVELLRTLNAHVLAHEDPAPERRVVFRIHADQITGRAATTR